MCVCVWGGGGGVWILTCIEGNPGGQDPGTDVARVNDSTKIV